MSAPQTTACSNLDYTLAELMVVAAAGAFADDGEVLATGIGALPRLAASLSMLTENPDLMMTDSQAWLLSKPNAISGRSAGDEQAQECWMGFSRIFDNVWSGRRHAMVGPTQIDRLAKPIFRRWVAVTSSQKSRCSVSAVSPATQSVTLIHSLCQRTVSAFLSRVNVMLLPQLVTTPRVCPRVTVSMRLISV